MEIGDIITIPKIEKKYRVVQWADTSPDETSECFGPKEECKIFAFREHNGKIYACVDAVDYGGINYYMVEMEELQRITVVNIQQEYTIY